MSTLLLRFAAPMQSWGLDKFERRGTIRMPTKSAVIGMAMAALGMKRNQEIPAWLTALRFGVRVDDEGVVLRDFQAVKSKKSQSFDTKIKCRNAEALLLEIYPNEKPGVVNSYITNRFYLCDAVFLVGLEGTAEQITQLEQAFINPVFPLYLGRKSCPPQGRLVLGAVESSLEQALLLEQTPWQVSLWRQKQKLWENPDIRLRVVMDAAADESGYFMKDMPVSFDFRHRRYGLRKVMDQPSLAVSVPPENNHDAYAEAKGDL